MFIWDFVADTVLGQIVDWIYSQVVGFLGVFFSLMGNMGADLFEMSWVQSIILFFSYLAWALFVTGVVMAGFEYAIESQSGRGNLTGTFQNILKGLLAVSMFTTVPVELYKLSVSLQGSFTAGQDWERILARLHRKSFPPFRMQGHGRMRHPPVCWVVYPESRIQS